MKKKTLLEYGKGDRVEILSSHCVKDIARRLCALGVFDGADLEIVKNDNFSPLIIKVFHSKIALARNEAGKIYAKKI